VPLHLTLIIRQIVISLLISLPLFGSSQVLAQEGESKTSESDPWYMVETEEEVEGETSIARFDPIHVHGHMVVHQRRFPGISTQTLYSWGGVVHWEILPFFSLGPYFRGFSTFVSGTNTTEVRTTFHDVGLTVNFFPFVFDFYGDKTHYFRLVFTLGSLINIHKMTFSHSLIVSEKLRKTASSFVFPIEAAFEVIAFKRVSIKYFLGFTFFAQAQSIYHGPAIGYIF